MANDHVDEKKVDLLRRKLIEGGQEKVVERFGESELGSAEIQKAKRQVKRRNHIGDTLHSRVDKVAKAEEAAAKSKQRSERLSKQAAKRGAEVQAKISPERELPKSATPQRSPKAAAAVRQAAARQQDHSRGR